MDYKTLYRQFRPTTFDEVIGQEVVVKTLINQIKENKIGHAYLFAGTRGTGKTSVARIFAHAINCENPVDGSPCKECKTCLSLRDNGIDIIEIDAASNNGIDEVRELREKIQYPPVNGKYKVYIIDEVHMLSTAAFNALLKTLEEPPQHAVLILCTTELHKVPQTILSRVLRFDFKLISNEELTKQLKSFLDKLEIKYTDEAISLIVNSAQGSDRDMLSSAERCISFDRNLTRESVLEVLGSSDEKESFKLARAILDTNIGEILSTVDKSIMQGKNPLIMLADLSSVFHDILVLNTVDDSSEILSLTRDRQNELKNFNNVDKEKVINSIMTLANAEQVIRNSYQPKIMLESTLLKCAKMDANISLLSLHQRLSKLEKGEVVVEPVKKEEEKKEVKVDFNKVSPQKIWGVVLNNLRERKDAFLYSACSLENKTLRMENNKLILTCSSKDDVDLINREIDTIKGILDSIEFEARYVEKEDTMQRDIDELRKLVGGNIKID